MIGIYKITNKINNKSYIGQSQNIELRWKQHIEAIKVSNKSWYPQARLDSNNIDDFEFTILQQCSIQELDELEEYWINYYNTYINGYNKTQDGQVIQHNGIKLIIKYTNYNNNLSSSILTIMSKLSQIKEITYAEKLLIILFLTQINKVEDIYITEEQIQKYTGMSHDTYIKARKHLNQLNILILNPKISITLSIDNLFYLLSK